MAHPRQSEEQHRTAQEKAAHEIAGEAMLDQWPWLRDHWERENGRLEDGGRTMPVEPFEAYAVAYREAMEEGAE